MIVLNQFAEPRDVLALVARGASGRGYLLKDRVRTGVDLGMAIAAVARGGSVVDPEVVSLLLAKPKGPRTALDALTLRELMCWSRWRTARATRRSECRSR